MEDSLEISPDTYATTLHKALSNNLEISFLKENNFY